MSNRDFPGGPMVETSPSNAGGTGSIPGQGTKIPYTQKNILNVHRPILSHDSKWL